MFNPIEARKRLVQERIEKSFQDNVGEQREAQTTSDVVEKAYNVGDEKDFNGRTYYVHSLNSKGQPMWRLKSDGAKKDEEGGGEKKAAKPEEKESISNKAAWASDEALKRAAADEKAKPEVREAAKKELAKREAHQKELAKRGGKKGEEKMKNAKEVYDEDFNDDLKYFLDNFGVFGAPKEAGGIKVGSVNDKGEIWVPNHNKSKDGGSEGKKKKKKEIEDRVNNQRNYKRDYKLTSEQKKAWPIGTKYTDKKGREFTITKHDSNRGRIKLVHETDDGKKKVVFLSGYDLKAGLHPNLTTGFPEIDKRLREVYDKAHENNNSNSASDNSNSVTEDDVKTFLTQKLGAENVDDRLISGVMEVVKNNTKVNESHGEKLIDSALQQMGYESGHKFENRGEYAKKLSDWVNKFALKNDKAPSDMVDWLNDNMETLYNLDDLDDDELDKFSNIEGWDELNDIINEMSDAFENPDTEEADFENMFLGALKSDMGELDNSRKGKAAQKKLVDLARDFVNKNPDLKLTAEDWQDIIGGDVDESDEKYGKLKGFRKLSNAIERFYDSVD